MKLFLLAVSCAILAVVTCDNAPQTDDEPAFDPAPPAGGQGASGASRKRRDLELLDDIDDAEAIEGLHRNYHRHIRSAGLFGEQLPAPQIPEDGEGEGSSRKKREVVFDDGDAMMDAEEHAEYRKRRSIMDEKDPSGDSVE